MRYSFDGVNDELILDTASRVASAGTGFSFWRLDLPKRRRERHSHYLLLV